jgi:hypothetical protein
MTARHFGLDWGMTWRDLFRRRQPPDLEDELRWFPSSGSWAGMTTERATDGSPLAQPYEGIAQELSRLVDMEEHNYERLPPDLRERYLDREYLDGFVHGHGPIDQRLRCLVEIRRIGHRLNDDAGVALMRQVAERAAVLSRTRSPLRMIELYWHRIGKWQS